METTIGDQPRRSGCKIGGEMLIMVIISALESIYTIPASCLEMGKHREIQERMRSEDM